MPQPPQQTRRRIRRHRAPLPLTESGELFEGGEILREVEGELAVVLWKSYKNAMLWAGAPRGERAGLFAGGAGERRREDVAALAADEGVAAPLLALAGLLDAPEAFESAEAAEACRRLSGWAAQRGASATALLFMQAAALSDPLDAEAAVTVGRLARDRAEYARAETWFRQAIVAARAIGAWSAYARAFVGLGKVHWQRGALPAARRCLHRAYRTATRHHLSELRGWALSDLGLLAIQAGRWSDARGYMAAALHLYGPEHPLARRLVHDAAYAWLSEGWFAPATRVLAAISPLFSKPEERVHLASSLARASGGAGEWHLFELAHAELEGLSDDAAVIGLVPDAWLDVAHGASSLGAWDVAERAAARALRMGIELGQARVRFGAEAALESIRADRAAQNASRSPTRSIPEPVDDLATELLTLVGAGA